MLLQIDRPQPLRPDLLFDVLPLENYLREQVPGFETLYSIEQFAGGFSNLTFCLHTNLGDWVLRRAPVGAAIQSAHDMEREHRVLTLLLPHYAAVPKPLLYCDHLEVMGAPFYLMERVEGIVLRGKDAKQLAQGDPVLLRRLCEGFVDNLAALHKIDIEATELIQLGKPDGYVLRQTEGWIGRFHRAHTDDCPDATSIEQWLRTHQPPPNPPTLLHNDYKFDNLVFAWPLEPEPHLLTVLDWEMTTVGDPLMDLGAALGYWVEPGDDPFFKAFNFTWLPGCLTRQELADRYARLTGRDLSALPFYYAFGLYKNAVILQQIYARWKAGIASDPRFEALGHGVRVLLQMAERTVKERANNNL